METQYIRLIAILSAIFIVELHSIADSWDNRFWPAFDSNNRIKDNTGWIFQSDAISYDLISAAIERITAVEKKQPSQFSDIYPTNIPTRRPDVLLETIKSQLKPYITKFIDPYTFPVPFEPASIQTFLVTNYVGTTPGFPEPNRTDLSAFKYFSVSSILARCSLPTNFFDYTPPRNLAGHIGKGSSHWTNSSGYGWDAMRSVITNLIFTYEDFGILINEEKSQALSDFVSDEFISPLNNACGGDTEIFYGPYSVNQLYYSNYTQIIQYNDSIKRNPININSPNNWYNRQTSFGFAGYIAAYLGTNYPQNKIINKQHEAYSFSYEFGIGPTNCGFNNTDTNIWVYQGSISKIDISADNGIYLTGRTVGLSTNRCDLWGSILPFDSGNVEAVPDVVVICGPSETTYPGAISTTDYLELQSRKKFIHIIKWDFTYK